MTDEERKNERQRRKRDQRRVWLLTAEQQAQQELRRLDNWIGREAVKQGVWQ